MCLGVATWIGIGSLIAAILTPLITVYSRNYSKYKKIGEIIPAKLLKTEIETPENDETSELGTKMGKYIFGWHDTFVQIDNREKVLERRLINKGNPLIIADAGVGKTRTTLEVIRSQVRTRKEFKKAKLVFITSGDNLDDAPVVKRFFLLKHPFVILFFDDIDKYYDEFDIAPFISKFKKKSKRTQCVATCRINEWRAIIGKKKGIIKSQFDKDEVQIPKLSYEEGKEIAERTNREFPDLFSGTASEILRGELLKKEEYEELEKSVEGKKQQKILHTVKLLHFANSPLPRVDLVEQVAEKRFRLKESYNTSFLKLKQTGFLKEQEGCVCIPDTFLSRVIVNYLPEEEIEEDYEPLIRELSKLHNILHKMKAFKEMLSLIRALIGYGRRDLAQLHMHKFRELKDVPSHLARECLILSGFFQEEMISIQTDTYSDVLREMKKEVESAQYAENPLSALKKKGLLSKEYKVIYDTIALFACGNVYPPKTELVRIAILEIFGFFGNWNTALEELKKNDIIEETNGRLTMRDSDLTQFIKETPEFEDLSKLADVLIEQKAEEELIILAETLLNLTDYTGALRCCNELLKMNKKNTNVILLRAKVYRSLNHFKKALKDLNRITKNILKTSKGIDVTTLTQETRVSQIYILKAEIELEQLRYQRALKSLEIAMMCDPMNVQVYHYRGECFKSINRPRKAKSAYENALDLDPNYAPSYLGRAELYKFEKNYASAIEDYDRVINNYKEAMSGAMKEQDVGKVVKIKPPEPWIYVERGICFIETEEYKKAIADFDEVLGVNPEYDIPHIYKAIAYLRLEKLEDSLLEITKAINVNSENALAYTTRCEIHFLLEDKDLAKEDIIFAKNLDSRELLRKLKSDYIEKKLIPTSLANLIIDEIEDLYALFTNEEKEVFNATLQSFHIS